MHIRPADEDLAVLRSLLLQHSFQTNGQSIEGLSGTGHPLDDDQRCFFGSGHQRFLEKILPDIARSDAIGLFPLIAQWDDFFAIEAPQLCLTQGLVRAENDELIADQSYREFLAIFIDLIDIMRRNAILLKPLEYFLWHKYFAAAAILLGANRRLFSSEIFRLDPHHLSFNPDQNIFGDQDHLILLFF